MTAGIVVQLAVDSLAATALYALIALAVASAYSGSGVLHLAIGQVAAAAALTAAKLLASGLSLWAAVPAGLGVGALLSATAERGLVAPARGRPLLGAVLLVAAGVLGQAVLVGLFPGQAYAFPHVPGTFFVFGGIVHVYDLVTVLVFAVVCGVGVAILRSGQLGASLRLTAAAPSMAERLGVDTGLMRTGSFALGGALAAAAALLAAPRVPLAATGGVALTLRGVAAAAAGRMTSRRRILAAALLIGVSEVVGQFYLGDGGEFCSDAVAVALIMYGWQR